MHKYQNIIIFRKPNLKPFRISKNKNLIDVFANEKVNLEQEE